MSLAPRARPAALPRTVAMPPPQLPQAEGEGRARDDSFNDCNPHRRRRRLLEALARPRAPSEPTKSGSYGLASGQFRRSQSIGLARVAFQPSLSGGHRSAIDDDDSITDEGTAYGRCRPARWADKRSPSSHEVNGGCTAPFNELEVHASARGELQPEASHFLGGARLPAINDAVDDAAVAVAAAAVCRSLTSQDLLAVAAVVGGVDDVDDDLSADGGRADGRHCPVHLAGMHSSASQGVSDTRTDGSRNLYHHPSTQLVLGPR